MNVAALEYRQGTLTSLLGVVEALRSLAAAKQQRAQAILVETQRFAEITSEGVAAFAPLVPNTQPGPTRFVLVGPEQGFTGGLAGRLVDALPPDAGNLLIIGARAASAAQARNHIPAQTMSCPGQVNALADLAMQLNRQLPTDAEIAITYATGAGPAQATLPALPAAGSRPDAFTQLPAARMGVDAARLDRLATLSMILLDSYLAEQLARLSTLTGARERIRERLEQLSMELTMARQESISQEIADLWAGRAAQSAASGG